MLSKKSKIEQLSKSRESRFSPASAAVSLSRTHTKLCGRLLAIRCAPPHRRTRYASAVLKNLVHLPEKPFSTASTLKRHSTTRAKPPAVRAKGGAQLPNSIIDIEKCNLGAALRQHVGPGHEQAVLGARLEMKARAAGPDRDARDRTVAGAGR